MSTRITNTPYIRILATAVGVLMISGCFGGGDTEGGKGKETANSGADARYVADGGAGATMTMDAPLTMVVGETDEFRVHLRDPQGQPLEYIRIFCESEKGIAILEPSSGGVGFEHTSVNGNMSGVLGALLPGSYIIECRAPDGFGLVVRQSIKISGPVPAGFVGFPGAAGGNLGGGRLVEQIPVDDEANPSTDGLGSLRISAVSVNDGGEKTSSGPIDIVQGPGVCDNGTAETDDDYAEPMFFNNFYIAVQNDSNEKATIGTVGFTIEDGAAGATSTQSKVVVIAAGASGEVDGLLTEFGGSGKVFAGSSSVVRAGTYRVNLRVTGWFEKSGDFTLTRSLTLTFANVNNCGKKSGS